MATTVESPPFVASGSIDVHNPRTGEHLYAVPEASQALIKSTCKKGWEGI